MITVKIDDSAVQQIQQRLAGLAPRIVASIFQALKPLVYESLRNAIPKYFSGSASKGASSALLTSRTGDLLNSVLQSVSANVDGDKLTISIGSDLPYAKIHEYGGFAGRRPPFKKKDGRRPYLPPRPYLQPAMNDLQQVLPDLLEQAIRQAQVAQ